MTPYTQDTLIGVVLILGVGIVGFVVATLWYRMVAPASFDRNTATLIAKVFAGIAVADILAMLIYRYL